MAYGNNVYLTGNVTREPEGRYTPSGAFVVEFGLAVARVPSGHKSRYGTYWAFIAGGPFEAWK